MSELSFGEPDTTWNQYNLLQYPIIFSEEETKYKAIVRGGSLVKILGSGYKLFPNEEALELANQAAKLVDDLTPFDTRAPGLRTNENVIYNDKETTMRAIYTLGKVMKVDSEDVKVGLNVFNSIDGSMAFGCGLFTFREMCRNGVIYGYEKIFSVKRIHTKGLEGVIENMKERMVLMMERGLDLIESYRRMAQEKVTAELVDKILKSGISKKVLPDHITLEYAHIIPNLNQWELYNDITELIWHNTDAGLQTRTNHFNALHRVMAIQVR